MAHNRTHGNEWPYSLPHGNRGDRDERWQGARRKFALALAGHHQFNYYFLQPFSEIIDNAYNRMSPIIVKVKKD